MEILLGKHWHALSSEQAAKLLETDLKKGLDLFEVEYRSKRFGSNLLSLKRGRGPLARFFSQFHQPLVYVLIAAGTITAVLHEWVDSGVIFGVVILNAVIGFFQASKIAKTNGSAPGNHVMESTVLRSGEQSRIRAEELVPGDIVILQAGDKIPADLRICQSRDLRVDQSSLSGNSTPVVKTEEQLPDETVLADRCNMAFASTSVLSGQATGIVVATGNKTEVGRISELISGTTSLETPLARKFSTFSRVLLYVIVGLSAVTFGAGLLRGYSLEDTFLAAVSLAVAAIPEGLPAVLAMALGIGVSRMAQRRAIVRRLPVVETLGSTTVLCSDKTGTLTKNQMTVREIFASADLFEVSGTGYLPSGHFTRHGVPISPDNHRGLKECLRAGLLCNDSNLRLEDEHWTIDGDPTEGALLVAAAKAGLSPEKERKNFPRLDSIPFEPHRPFMATLHSSGPQSLPVISVKGAAEVILDACVDSLDSNFQHFSLDRARISQAIEEMTAKGLRVLALARKEGMPEQRSLALNDLRSDLTFLGLQGMIDPPRNEAIAALASCHSAGIQVKMITGDHPGTAAAIAAQLGLFRPVKGHHVDTAPVTGKTLATLSDREITELAERTVVFSRVSPEQKLRLVKAIQSRGHIVALTGSSVNDAAALKKADIGVALGIAGTEAAKDAADVVLTDDNFATVEAAVEEGRGVFDNLTKFIIWTLPTNIGQGLVIMVAVLAGVTLPILPIQILWLNMVTAVLLGLTLAFEAKEPDIMRRRPRDPHSPILTFELTVRIVVVGTLLLLGAFGLFEWELIKGSSPDAARTVAVNVFVLVQIGYLLKCRSLTKSVLKIGIFSNPWIWAGIFTALGLQLLFTYAPSLNWVFHSGPVSLGSWLRALGIAVITWIVVSLEKLLWREKISQMDE
ncbi:MAG: HAD-IC family P-type ATPase [Deltaproteobacteria bacterium]|nr:HAD-IC family P-type ATPase [Deltaproteobacteria bacterium]